MSPRGGSDSPSSSMASSRPFIITGNWKMYKTIEEAKGFIETLAPKIKKSQARVYLAVPFTAILPATERVKELRAPITIGAQNMNDAREGAFTGEIAAVMLKDAGAHFVILGHSERRLFFHEDNDFIQRKIKRAIEEQIQPILCIGESQEEKEGGKREAILRHQIELCLETLTPEEIAQTILAYEPIWAIGTGNIADALEVQDTHSFCRSIIQEGWGREAAEQMVIQYGGSVKPENVADMVSQPDIDGLLIGGASLSAESFYQIISTATKARNKMLKKMELPT